MYYASKLLVYFTTPPAVPLTDQIGITPLADGEHDMC